MGHRRSFANCWSRASCSTTSGSRLDAPSSAGLLRRTARAHPRHPRSERLFYQKITDIYATSIDYDPNAEITQTFFKTVQNKLHWAIHGHTAAEIIHERADATKPNMGLTTWKNAPHGQGPQNGSPKKAAPKTRKRKKPGEGVR